MNKPVHLRGAHARAESSTDSTDNLAEITCEACREHVRALHVLCTVARRNGSVRWLASSIHSTVDPARGRAFQVLEELGDDGSFRRFDLRRWLAGAPGVHDVTLRVRKGEAR